MIDGAGPWGTGPYKLVEGFSLPDKRSDLVVLEANTSYWDKSRLPRVMRIVFDNTLSQKEAVEVLNPVKGRDLLREAGYPDGLSVALIAPEDLEVQATVVSRMLAEAGFRVERQILDPTAYGRKTVLSHLDQPADKQAWDIALTAHQDVITFPILQLYHQYAVDGYMAWLPDPSPLRGLYTDSLRAVHRETQQALIRQMERDTHEQAYFLFLYNPIQLYAVNRGVEFVPYASGILHLAGTSVTDQHRSVRKNGTKR